MERIVAAFQVFRAVTVTTVGPSTALASTVTGGVLPSTVQTLRGAATCITTMAVWAGPTTVRREGFLFVASGINLFDSFDHLIIFTLSAALAESKGDYYREAVDFLKMALYSDLPDGADLPPLMFALIYNFSHDLREQSVRPNFHKETIILIYIFFS